MPRPSPATPSPGRPDVPEDVRLALAHAALLIARFRWRLGEAGYPFKEPPDTQAVLTRIDAVLFPEEIAKVKVKPRGVR